MALPKKKLLNVSFFVMKYRSLELLLVKAR